MERDEFSMMLLIELQTVFRNIGYGCAERSVGRYIRSSDCAGCADRKEQGDLRSVPRRPLAAEVPDSGYTEKSVTSFRMRSSDAERTSSATGQGDSPGKD